MSAKKPDNHCPTCGIKIKRNSEACKKHCKRDVVRLRSMLDAVRGKGEEHHMWMGKEVSYSPLHKWLRKYFGKPDRCEECKTVTAKRFEWANMTGIYDRSRRNYAMLCKSCHVKKDRWGYTLTIQKAYA